MKIAGLILIIVGIVDVGGSFIGFDLWGQFIGINLPDIIWYCTGYVELGLGFVLFNSEGNGNEIDEEDPDN